MERAVDKGLPAKQSGDVRRAMLMFLAFVYLFVGMAHNVSCLDEAVASSFAIEQTSAPSEEDGKNAASVICDHCPTCVPALMPVTAAADVPSARPSQPVESVVPVLIADHPRLDTPPPKRLT